MRFLYLHTVLHLVWVGTSINSIELSLPQGSSFEGSGVKTDTGVFKGFKGGLTQ